MPKNTCIFQLQFKMLLLLWELFIKWKSDTLSICELWIHFTSHCFVKSFISKTTCKIFRMQLVTNLIILFYISITYEGPQIPSGFEADCSTTAEMGTQTQSHITNDWKSDISLKLPKGAWNLYILLLSFHFCVILHLVFLCRSIRELRKPQDKRFHGALSPKLQMRNYKCC